jgi:hypothetical protein
LSQNLEDVLDRNGTLKDRGPTAIHKYAATNDDGGIIPIERNFWDARVCQCFKRAA